MVNTTESKSPEKSRREVVIIRKAKENLNTIKNTNENIFTK